MQEGGLGRLMSLRTAEIHEPDVVILCGLVRILLSFFTTDK